MKFTTITCTVVKRIKRDRSQSIRIANVYGYNEGEDGSSKYVKYKDCWLPFEWYNKKNQRKQLSFREDTPEEVQQKHQARLQEASSLCEGSACCPGTVAGQPVYDAALNLCVNSQDTFANMKMKNKVKPTPSNKPNEFEDYAKV